MESPATDQEECQHVLDEIREVDFGCAKILLAVALSVSVAVVIVAGAWMSD